MGCGVGSGRARRSTPCNSPQRSAGVLLCCPALASLNRKARGVNYLRRVAIICGLLVTLFAATAAVTGAQAASIRYVRGWSVQNGMLCYGFSNGTWHCTSYWKRVNGLYISLRPAFVPSQGSSSGGTTPPPVSPPPPAGNPSGCPGAGLPAVGYVSNGMHWAPGGIPNDSCQAVQAAPYGGSLSLWKVPPAPFNAVSYVNRNLYPARVGWPVCAWWGRELNPDYSSGKGLWGQTKPRVGATVRYAAGVLGAGSAGHVGHVVAVYSNGWFLSSEMNFYWRGGGAGKVVFRFVPSGVRGVTFVY